MHKRARNPRPIQLSLAVAGARIRRSGALRSLVDWSATTEQAIAQAADVANSWGAR